MNDGGHLTQSLSWITVVYPLFYGSLPTSIKFAELQENQIHLAESKSICRDCPDWILASDKGVVTSWQCFRKSLNLKFTVPGSFHISLDLALAFGCFRISSSGHVPDKCCFFSSWFFKAFTICRDSCFVFSALCAAICLFGCLDMFGRGSTKRTPKSCFIKHCRNFELGRLTGWKLSFQGPALCLGLAGIFLTCLAMHAGF